MTIIVNDRNEGKKIYNRLLNDSKVTNLLFKITRVGTVIKYKKKA